MSENLSAQLPNPPDLQPMPAPRSKFWQIISLVLIIGGLVLLGTGGWMFYQLQLEASKPPPARILDPAEVLAEFEAQTQAASAEAVPSTAVAQDDPDRPSQTGRSDTPASEPAQPTKASELNPASSQSGPLPILPYFIGDAVPAEATEAPAGDIEVTQNEASGQSEDLEAETAIEQDATEFSENVPQPQPLSMAEAKFLEEAALNQQATSVPEMNAEAPPSLEENPLVVPEADLSAPAEVPAAVPNSASPTRLVVESIDLDADVVAVGWQEVIRGGVPTNIWTVADYAAGWHQNSALPGEGGNIVLSGHHNIKGEVFRYLVNIEVNDIVSLYVGDQRYDYVVDDKFIVKDKGEPEAIRRANAKWIGPFNEERLTLVTCWPYTNNTHRLIVIAKPL